MVHNSRGFQTQISLSPHSVIYFYAAVIRVFFIWNKIWAVFPGCVLWILLDKVGNIMYFCSFQNGRLISNSFTYCTHRARTGWGLVVACDWMSSCLHCWWTKLPFTTVAQNTQNLSQDFHWKLREETLSYYMGIKTSNNKRTWSKSWCY